MAKIQIKRKTNETDIQLSLEIYGSGKSKITTGVGFFDHMLELFTFHSCFDLEITAKGDLQVCAHHTVEDVGIVFGQAFYRSLPEAKNFTRYASVYLPMDESLVRAVVDISGRPHLVFKGGKFNPKVGDFDTELVREFFQAFVNHAQITLHLEVLYGENTHHQIEALFKGAARALRAALEADGKRSGVASTKGKL